jgi:hypothetical protein
MNARLIAAGWRHTPTGRWIHPDAPPLALGRRRLFTEAEALTLLAADTDEDTQPECCDTETEVTA